MGATTTYLPVTDGGPLVVDIGDSQLEYEPVDDAITRAQGDRKRHVIVLAPNLAAAASFAKDHGLLRRQVVYATPSSVRGYSNVDVVVLAGWRERSDAERIWHALLPVWACGRRK